MTISREKWWSRILARIDFGNGCWLWPGKLNDKGYAIVVWRRRPLRLHRLMYIDRIGPIPEGLEPDHLCRIRRCVRPDHLEVVTHRVNCLRGESPIAQNARHTHCPQGHSLTDSYVYRRGERVHRVCRRCRIQRSTDRNKKIRREKLAATLV